MGFEPTISAGERPQTYALDRVASGTGVYKIYIYIYIYKIVTVHAIKRHGLGVEVNSEFYF